MNRSVNLTKRVQAPKGKRFFPDVISANGHGKPDTVLVNGCRRRDPSSMKLNHSGWTNGVVRWIDPQEGLAGIEFYPRIP